MTTNKTSSLFIALLCLVSFRGEAQNINDSIALMNTQWKIVTNESGVVCKSVNVKLFDTDQQISYMEIDPTVCRLELVQEANRETVATIGRHKKAIAAINGGYFNTHTTIASANDYIKINNKELPIVGGWGNGAVAFDEDGKPHFRIWSPGDEQNEWLGKYKNVMVVGPMLLIDNKFTVGPDTERHPRSIIGTKDDGTMVLFVVDGRQEGADGMSFFESANVARYLGVTSALNLDGGGSSCLWMDGKGNVNSPSDKFIIFTIPRMVCNAIVVMPKI